MTTTPVNPAPVQLTEYDEVLGADEQSTLSRDDPLRWVLNVTFFLYPETPVQVRVYPKRDQAVIRLGGRYAGQVAIDVDAEQLDRLINVLTVARDRLRRS
mgnify:CR=1 FL=1